MTIPQEPLIEETLSRIEVTTEGPDELTDILNSPRPKKDWDGNEIAATADESFLFIRYPENGLKPSTVRRLICRELEARGHAADDWIAISLLGLMSVARKPSESAIEFANQFLDTMRPAVLHHIVAKTHAPCMDQLFRVELGDVFFERFDPSKILYWLDKGGTSRFFWDPEKVPECYSFRRNPFNIQLISWDLILSESSFQKMDESEGGKFLDAYYSSVFYCYKDEIKKLILEGSLVLEAGKLHYFGDS